VLTVDRVLGILGDCQVTVFSLRLCERLLASSKHWLVHLHVGMTGHDCFWLLVLVMRHQVPTCHCPNKPSLAGFRNQVESVRTHLQNNNTGSAVRVYTQNCSCANRRSLYRAHVQPTVLQLP
jgi:hypothetical protein